MNVKRHVESVPSKPASGGQSATPAKIIYPTRDQQGVYVLEYLYDYDVFGNRVGQTLNKPQGDSVVASKEAYLFENSEVFLEFHSQGGNMVLAQEHLFDPGSGQKLAIDDTSFSGPIWILSDYQQSARVLYVSNTVQAILEYDHYGSVNLSEGSSALNIAASVGYMGMEYSDETRLYWDGSRFYDPVAGRFTSESKSGYVSGNTNLYVFANNTPADRIGKSDSSAVDPWTYYRGTPRALFALNSARSFFTLL